MSSCWSAITCAFRSPKESVPGNDCDVAGVKEDDVLVSDDAGEEPVRTALILAIVALSAPKEERRARMDWTWAFVRPEAAGEDAGEVTPPLEGVEGLTDGIAPPEEPPEKEPPPPE